MQHRKPYIGATVHYRFREHDTPMAAIITHVHDDQWVSLFLIPPGGTTRACSHVEHGLARGWSWITENSGASVATDYPSCLFP